VVDLRLEVIPQGERGLMMMEDVLRYSVAVLDAVVGL